MITPFGITDKKTWLSEHMYKDRHLEKLYTYTVKKKNTLITTQKAEDTNLLFNLAWSLHNKYSFLSKFNAERL
jgi:hypothetical protein